MSQYEKKPQFNWRKVASTTGPTPKPRHGHRVVNANQLMIILGGGCDGLVDETSVFNTATNVWQSPELKGDIPPARAAFGLASDDPRVYIFGGMLEYGIYSNDLYELQINKWEWKKLSPIAPNAGEYPCPRIGHSFTVVGKRIFMFGGLSNISNDPNNNVPVYLNDLYILNFNKQSVLSWEIPLTYGEGPSVRESHSAVAFFDDNNQKNYLVIYGGMNGKRLGDTWLLDTDSMKWECPKLRGAIPLPRSLHSSTLIGYKMYIFGGWTPTLFNAKRESEWRCTNTLGCLNLNTMTWEAISLREHDKDAPKARAGHCSIAIGGRMYIWSGRDGYRKAWNEQASSTRVPQVCCNDMWFLETLLPQKANKIKLIKTTNNSIELMWNPVPGVSHYLLQVQKIEHIMQPSVKPLPTKIASNLIVRKSLVNSPTFLKKVVTPQTAIVVPNANPMVVQKINQEILKPAIMPTPKQIIVNPKKIITTTESSQLINQHKRNTVLDNRAIVIAKPTTVFQIVKKMPRGSLGSFKFTDKDGMPVNVVQKVSVNTVPSTSQFRTVDNFKQTLAQRTVMFQKKSSYNKPPSSTDIELPNNKHYDEESDKFDQLDGASDPETFQIKNLSNHHLGLDEPISDNNSCSENEESGHEDEARASESNGPSDVLTLSKENEIEEPSYNIDNKWDTIDILKDSRKNVRSYISYNDWNISKIVDFTSDNIPDLSQYERVILEAGSFYQFRVAGVNSLGVGEFSETVEFRTNSFGICGAPHTVRIGKQKDGIMITWMPPTVIHSEILEYVVLMATKQDVNSDNKNFILEGVYCGQNTHCLVKYKIIQKAHVDNDSMRPSISFRISARNENGHGTATQVKWIQDQTFSPKRNNADTEINNNNMKKKRLKSE